MSLGAPQFEPRWSTAKAMLIGYLTGRGRTARAIAEFLADGTSPETIRGQWRRHRICDRRRDGVDFQITLSTYELRRLEELALARGLDPEDWIHRVTSAAIRDDLFDAVVDEQSPKPKCDHGGGRRSKAFSMLEGCDE
ncbi:hypothetical protein PRN20_04540 [Devosia sp. ZB163]|uniref:hypothetical protein n=1 Tax=Devosia sp. ZB163 TaxID=3025938 RepID=UPI00235FBB61|nr:hypothetical protein [Devosia sp. ZB163]MDC9822990.1 hypothetical protein [Devosia sp. ZB163]